MTSHTVPSRNRVTVQLILGKSDVQSAQGVSFHLNPAQKHPENPVLIPGFPHEWDSLQVNWPSRVCYDPHDRLFKCWYHGLDAVQYDVATHPERRGFEHWLGRLWRTGYAESADGIHWTKPALGQHTHRGQDTNVIVTDYEAAGTGAAGMCAAFSVHKVLSAAYVGLATLAFSLLEPALGISRLFIGCAAAGGVLWAGLAFLRAPTGCPSQASVRETKSGPGAGVPEAEKQTAYE